MRASVVLPAYNSERFIRPAIESILAQTFADFELIIVDDCSRDATWDVVQEYARQDPRIVAIRNEANLNLARSLNLGIARARGEYIVRMDHDDIAVPERIEKQVRFLDAHPEVGIVGCSMEIIDEEGKPVGLREYNLTDEEIRRHIFLYSPFSHPAVTMRRALVNEIGGYDHATNPAEDYDLYFRIGLKAKFANLPEPLLRYRVVRGTSMTTGGTRRLERKTIEVRRRYARMPRYPMRPVDRLYNAVHFLSLYLVPSRFKIWLFGKFRNTHS